MLSDTDLLDAAPAASKALLIDWKRLGLIHAHAPGRGRGSGRAPRQWTPVQRDLLLKLRRRRERGATIRELADVVVSRWLLAKPGIPTEQARRSLETWARPERLRSRRVARQLARELVAALPTAFQDELVDKVADSLREGRPLQLPLLEDVPTPRPSDLRPPPTRSEVAEHLGLELLIDELELNQGVEYESADLRVSDDVVQRWRERTPGADRLLREHRPAAGILSIAYQLAEIVDVVSGIVRLPLATDAQLETARSRLYALDRRRTSGACRALLAALRAVPPAD